MQPSSSILLGARDPAPLLIENAASAGPVLVICDHAGKAVPEALRGLGIGEADLARHIGWDIGAASVASELARLLRASLIRGVYSRLVLDLNRDPKDPSQIAEISDGTAIPVNRGLSESDRRQRVMEIFAPYHAAIAARLDWIAALGTEPVLVGIHSFTPVMNGTPRPWQVGVLWNRDGRLPIPLMERLGREPGITVGDNEPYSGRLYNYTLNRHGEGRGIRHASIEIRQDLIGTQQGAHDWARRLQRALAPLLA